MPYTLCRSIFCNLLLFVLAICLTNTNALGQATVSGTITCEAEIGVKNVVINVGGIAVAVTDENGYYELELPAGGDYTLMPYANSPLISGISTFDLVLIGKHIDEIEFLDSPYKIIAADVNNSSTVDQQDLADLGSLIDFTLTSFPNNTSWRFIPSDYIFPNPADPFMTSFPEVSNINNLTNDITDLDFIAIKVGDVSGSVCSALLDTTQMGKITGNLLFDLNENCALDGDETGLANWIVEMSGDETFYANSNETGTYSGFVLPGSYDVKVISPNNLWDPCQSIFSIFIGIGEEINVDFLMKAVEDCPFLNVDLSTPFLRRCNTSKYYVQYCNDGTSTASDAFVEIEFDPYLTVETSTLPWTSVNGNLYTFDLGDVEAGVCGTFDVTVDVSCDAFLGQTHCTEAHIFPDSLCVPTDPLWDGSSLQVEGYCEGDSVHFQITNIGENMTEPVGFVVIEDIMIQLTSPIQLNSLETFNIGVEANGATWRIEVDQVAFHPSNSLVTATIEGCGTNGNGTVSLGIVTQFPMDDQDAFVDVDCRENIGSYDPNDKLAFPKGACTAHHIKQGTDLEYHIRFQNTGTDTAFNVIVRDTLSPFLDPATVQVGVSSHPYEFEIRDNGVLEFSFENIMLPDSNVNEMESHGFVKFKISQRDSVALGSLIENQAAIYFDFNLPVFTNTYFHTIGEDFLEPPTGNLTISGTITRFPAQLPEDSVTVFLTDNCPVYTDQDGYYLFTNVDANKDYAITPEKMGDFRDGITVMDIMKVRLGILFIDPEFWDDPFNWIAADINNSGGISAFDLVMMNFAILDVETANPDQFPWIFHDKSVPFSSNPPFTPLAPSILLDSLTESKVEQDFYVIKKGDLVNEQTLPLADMESVFYFEKVEDCSGQMVFDLKATGFGEHTLNSFQFALNWDSEVLEFAEVTPAELPDFTSSQFYQNDDETLSVVWFSNNLNFEPDDSLALLRFHFNVLGGIGTNTTISLDNEQLPFMAFANFCERTETDFDEFTALVSQGDPIVGDLTSQNVTCHSGNDGFIELFMSGGMPPYSYDWNTGDSTALIENLVAGTYTCTMSDQENCQFQWQIEIIEPDPIEVTWNVMDASSPTANNGFISLNEIIGGTPPFMLNPSGPLDNLPPNDYVFTIEDSHGCIIIDTVTISFVNNLDELDDLGIQLTFMPNPVESGARSFLKINNPKTDHFTIKVLDGIGQEISEIATNVPAGQSDYPLNLPTEKGLYFIEISNEVGARKVFKVVVF